MVLFVYPALGTAQTDIGWCGQSRAACMGLYSPPPQTPRTDPNTELEEIRQRVRDGLSRVQRTPAPSQPARIPAFAYYNPITDEFYRGDQIFHRDDHGIAIQTMDQRNTSRPSGVGWRAITEAEYGRYLSIVLGTTRPIDQTIYNNCVVTRSRGASPSALREVRASCRITARDPSVFDRLRWGN